MAQNPDYENFDNYDSYQDYDPNEGYANSGPMCMKLVGSGLKFILNRMMIIRWRRLWGRC
jgi:hypothetical protein